MAVLVTGGAGYIGSHTVKKLTENGFDVVVLDNLSRGHRKAVPDNVHFEKTDLLDEAGLKKAIRKYNIDSVIHFAAFAYVGESVENPGLYYQNNVVGSFNLIKVINELGIKKFVFSSTCSIYGNPENVPISENEPPNPINPYARTKYMIENILSDFETAHGLKYAALRYFNAAGDSDDASIGESHDPEPHLIPLVLFTALGKRDSIKIYGDDYETPDGTCIRDYIHVNDLADAHIKALQYIEKGDSTIINLGTGNGYSVKEIIDAARKITGKEIKSEIVGRRAGDPAILVADNKKAKELLDWKPKYNLERILETAWNWHKNQKY
ncbi:MAG: UDP-glucose 4-epimerase GalE [Ignavibacteriae bacterium]|nr:UDP-glucose 4-epimerase GalE [Ignavibacteriota bacterium]